MKKLLVMIIVAVFAFSGCSTISNLAKQGMKSAEVAAEKQMRKMVDKEAGDGSYDEMIMLQNKGADDLWPYYLAVNKAKKDNKIDDVEAAAKKKELDGIYDQYRQNQISEVQFKEQCTNVVNVQTEAK